MAEGTNWLAILILATPALVLIVPRLSELLRAMAPERASHLAVVEMDFPATTKWERRSSRTRSQALLPFPYPVLVRTHLPAALRKAAGWHG